MDKTTSKLVDMQNSLISALEKKVNKGQNYNILEFIENVLETPISKLYLAQRVIFKAVYKLPFDSEEAALMQLWVSNNKTNWKEISEEQNWKVINIQAGMRSSKSWMAAAIALYEFYKWHNMDNPREFYGLLQGAIVITCLATTETQVKDTIFGKIVSFYEGSSYFTNNNEISKIDTRVRSKTKDMEIIAAPANPSALVGKTSIVVVFDEACRMHEPNALGSVEAVRALYTSVQKSITNISHFSKVITVSSAWEKGDFMEYLIERDWEYAERGYLCFNLSTLDIASSNANVAAEVATQLEVEPIAALRDFYNVRPESQSAFLDPNEVNKALISTPMIYTTPKDITVNEHTWVGVDYANIPKLHFSEMSYIHGDPGVSGDSYAITVARPVYMDGVYKCLIDCVITWVPTKTKTGVKKVSFDSVEQTVIELCKKRNVGAVTLDHFQGEGLIQKLQLLGINASEMHFNRTQQTNLYMTFRQWLNAGRIILPKDIDVPPYNIMVQELKSLMLIGGTKVDHPKTGSKDIADTIVGALSHVVTHEANYPSGGTTNNGAVTLDRSIFYTGGIILAREAAIPARQNPLFNNRRSAYESANLTNFMSPNR